jgi:hypothetical protein
LFEVQNKGTLLSPTREEQWLLRYSRPTEIMMLGVWDTVAAIDWPGATQHDFLDPNLRRNMKNAFHAMALDEHRHRFAPTLWTQSSPKASGPPKIERDYATVEQRWFVGAHANVGGGYPSDLLPQLPLNWMMEKADKLGLAFREKVDVEDGAFLDPIVDSYEPFLCGLYKYASAPYFRPLGEPAVEKDGYLVQAINETIDVSVFDRWRKNPNYRPPNLKQWSERHGIDPGKIGTPVRADDPRAAFSHSAKLVS